MKRLLVFFCVVAGMVACDDFLEHDISGEQITVIGPLGEASLYTGDVLFAWREVPHATAYQITIVSPDFRRAALVVADTVMRNDTVRTHTRYIQLLEPGDYQWSIRAFNSGYSTVEKILSLHIMALPEPEPEPTDPGEEEPGEEESGEEEPQE